MEDYCEKQSVLIFHLIIGKNGWSKFVALFIKWVVSNLKCKGSISGVSQRYTYRVLQTIQMQLILLCVWAEWAILGSAKTALKFKYDIQFNVCGRV